MRGRVAAGSLETVALMSNDRLITFANEGLADPAHDSPCSARKGDALIASRSGAFAVHISDARTGSGSTEVSNLVGRRKSRQRSGCCQRGLPECLLSG